MFILYMPCYEMFVGPLEIDLSFNNLLKACILFLLSCFGDITWGCGFRSGSNSQ